MTRLHDGQDGGHQGGLLDAYFNADDNYYKVIYCPFCGETLHDELEDEVEWEDEDD